MKFDIYWEYAEFLLVLLSVVPMLLYIISGMEMYVYMELKFNLNFQEYAK